jgi:hypothetical protein
MQSSGVFDQENGATNPGSVVTIQPGSITPSVNGALVVTGLTFQQQDEFLNISTPMGMTAHVILSPDNYVGLGLAYWFQPTAGAIDPTWYWSRNTNANPSAVIASFKTSGATGGNGGAWGFA